MSSPRHSPPPSAAAPKPKGILKNANNGIANTVEMVNNDPPQQQSQSQILNDQSPHLAWDEGNLILHEMQREQQDPRMKIDEPKTPFVRSSSIGPMDDDTNFDLMLDNNNQQQQATNYFPGEPSSSSSGSTTQPPPLNTARRSSAAEVLAANTKANAGGVATNQSTNSSSAATAAIGLDSVDLAATATRSRDSTPSSSRKGGSESRSPSFTLPNSRRSSAAGGVGIGNSREGVRKELLENQMDIDHNYQKDEQAFEDDEDQQQTEESKAKQDAFARKRNAHYGNEAEAMKIAAALAAKDDEEEDDEDEDDEENQVPPLPTANSNHLPNGRA